MPNAKQNLVIVESPSKAKTIGKYLGPDYQVKASMGHLRDLPKSTLSVDIEHDFEPEYQPLKGKEDIIADLRKAAKGSGRIYLATDPDREGEAISWHLKYLLNIPDNETYRVTFNEITRNVVQESIQHPRPIDQNLVDAQQARRVLDRIVGYQLSPLLWKKIRKGLSAGRVQSVATRLVVDRENEIRAFVPQEYWTLDASLQVDSEKKPLVAKYYGTKEGKVNIKSKEQIEEIMKECREASYEVAEIRKGERTKKSPLPFTTSTLQQEASKVLNFSTQKTMRLAQQLYEGVEIKGSGTVGVITYLRTDSTRISEEAQAVADDFIKEHYGDRYAAGGTREDRKDNKKIQDAHEAIRPTSLTFSPVVLKESLSRDQLRLYQLIYNRFLASQMTSAVYETTSVKIDAGKHRFTVAASKLVFDGFMSVYIQEDDKEETNTLTKGLDERSKLKLLEFEEKQHFTQPAPHYTEASLVRALEELGIGRPSTYAPTITTILARRYVVKENKNLYVTELGEVVNNIMKEAFPSIVDVNFTANMEILLDSVEEGKANWKTIISNFYPDLDEAVKIAEKELAEVEIKDEVSDQVCGLCGRQMVIKYGPHGKFLACPGFPECRNTMPYYEKIGVACPKCGRDLVQKMTRKGRKYYGCLGAPECDFMVWQRPSGDKCPKCGSLMLYKGNKLACMNENCGYVTKIEKKED